MAYIKANFKLSKTSSTNIFVEEVKLNTKYSPSFKFKFTDRPLKYHPIIEKHLNNLTRTIKSTDKVNLELSGNDLEIYYDIKSLKFWFNGFYLEPTIVEESDDVAYDLSMDPNSFVSQFIKSYKSLKEVDKVFKFLDLCPADSANLLRLEAR